MVVAIIIQQLSNSLCWLYNEPWPFSAIMCKMVGNHMKKIPTTLQDIDKKM
jgi:hypothetical protein